MRRRYYHKTFFFQSFRVLSTYSVSTNNRKRRKVFDNNYFGISLAIMILKYTSTELLIREAITFSFADLTKFVINFECIVKTQKASHKGSVAFTS